MGHHLIATLAYIDPGTGSLFFQMLVAGILSAGLFVKDLRVKVMMLFSKKKTGEIAAPDESGKEPPAPGGA